MQTRLVVVTCLAAGLTLCASPGHAVNTTFLRDSPIQAMSEEDLTLVQQSAYRALDQTPDGEALSWNNPSTGAHGTITPTATWEDRGQRCRSLQFEHEVKGRVGKPRLDFCKQPDGEWKIISR